MIKFNLLLQNLNNFDLSTKYYVLVYGRTWNSSLKIPRCLNQSLKWNHYILYISYFLKYKNIFINKPIKNKNKNK